MFDVDTELLEAFVATAKRVVDVTGRYPLALGDQGRVNDLKTVIQRAERQLANKCPARVRNAA